MIFDEAGNYLPIVYGNEFWLLSDDLSPINDTVEVLNLDMTYEPLGLVKWNLMAQMDESFALQRVRSVFTAFNEALGYAGCWGTRSRQFEENLVGQ